MLLGDILVAQGLVTTADVAAALERQQAQGGGILGDHLVALGKLTPADLQSVMRASPPHPAASKTRDWS